MNNNSASFHVLCGQYLKPICYFRRGAKCNKPGPALCIQSAVNILRLSSNGACSCPTFPLDGSGSIWFSIGVAPVEAGSSMAGFWKNRGEKIPSEKHQE